MTRYHFSFLFSTSFLFFLVTACTYSPQLPSKGAYLVDSGGRHIATLDVGGSLEAGARGLLAGQAYNFELTLDGERVSFARLAANTQGEVAPFHLWFYSGVVGCSLREKQPDPLPQFMFRNFDEALSALDGRSLTLNISPSKQPSKSPRTTSATATALINDHPIIMQVGQKLEIPMQMRRSPLVYPSTKNGCLLNSAEAGAQAMYVSGRHFKPGELVEVTIAPNQNLWRVGDIANDVTGVSGAASSEHVKADANGRFTIKVWGKALQRRGVYDIITRRNLNKDSQKPWIIQDDIISYGSDSAYILYLRYPSGGPLMDIAGRSLMSNSPLGGAPYFEYTDAFAETDDDVWGAVDPTYLPDGHPGGRYAAYHIVEHRDVLQWDTDSAVPNPDVSGAVEIVPVKAGSINATASVIWSGTKPAGAYDVVVNFGSTPAETMAAFNDDMTYDSALHFLDGADQIGFRVAKDPYERGPIPIGEAEYSFDNALWLSDRVTRRIGESEGTPTVDLRAVVRYPASTAGEGTPVRDGRHPVFIIEHGNHGHCDDGPNTAHETCVSRKRNHRGYDELLKILASHGVIAVSIDAYDLTGNSLPAWIEERGDLIHKHLEFWSHLDNADTYTSYTDPFAGLFQQHVDMSKISVSGHSRGGEASVAAYDKNEQQFSINSVSSIAPTDSNNYILGDVPYLVLIPAADCDVSNLDGVPIYDRAGGQLDNSVKSGIYIYGANHNFFNTVWAADEDDCQTDNPNRIEFIPAADQQRIGEAYLAAFVRAHLLNEDVYEDMFREDLRFPSTAGYKIYTFHHEKEHKKLDNGGARGYGKPEDDVIALPHFFQRITGMAHYATQTMQLIWRVRPFDVLNARYTYSFPRQANLDASVDISGYEVLSFRAAQTNRQVYNVNPITGQEFIPSNVQEFRVKLISGEQESEVLTGQFNLIPRPYDLAGDDQTVMTTVRIPLQSFIRNNPSLELDKIEYVEILFSKPHWVDPNLPDTPAINSSQGDIYIDDIEFSR